jgi:hypothetical protein
MTERMTLERILELKDEARELEKRVKLKHHEALKFIADREGFSSWTNLVNTCGGGGPELRARSRGIMQSRRERRRAQRGML